MRLAKAIEVSTQHQKGTDPLYLPELPEAERLGIEALKRIEAWRNDNNEDLMWDLPGETEE